MRRGSGGDAALRSQTVTAWRWARRVLPDLLLVELRRDLLDNLDAGGPLDFQARTLRIGKKGSQRTYKVFVKPKGFLFFYSIFREEAGGHLYRELASDEEGGFLVRTTGKDQATEHWKVGTNGAVVKASLLPAEFQKALIRLDEKAHRQAPAP